MEPVFLDPSFGSQCGLLKEKKPRGGKSRHTSFELALIARLWVTPSQTFSQMSSQLNAAA
jgi:hypothetical protein